jgi:hypothetical protein
MPSEKHAQTGCSAMGIVVASRAVDRFFSVSTAVKYSLMAVVVIGAAIVWFFWRQKTPQKGR